ncbi:MAG TPA: tetratricopeptide repeat protein [Ktedonobacterales bacterium]
MAKHEKRGTGSRRERQPGAHQARDSRGNARRGDTRRGTELPALDQAGQDAVAALLDGVGALAEHLRAAAPAGREQVVAALEPVVASPVAVQLGYADGLGTVRGPLATAAAEVANALGELAPDRDVAHMARRARHRLRSRDAVPTLALAPQVVPIGSATAETRAAPAREAMPARPPAVPAPAPKLVEAHASRTRETGEVSLVLAWQEGEEPAYVRGCVIDLNFWEAGVKGFALTEPRRRTRFLEDATTTIHREHPEAELVAITWATARRLLLAALDVNAWRGIESAADYRRHQGLVSARLLDIPDDEDARAAVAAEDASAARAGDRAFFTPDLDPDEVVGNWLGAWTFGDYGAAYDLLADDHPTRRAQTRDEYIAQRRQWADEARPASMRLTLVREQAQRASALWLPGATGGVAPGGRREIEAFWSITLRESPLGGAMEELPMASISSAVTGRHWYWTGHTLERDRSGAWRIARDRDESAASQALTPEELQKRIDEARASAERAAEIPANAPEDVVEDRLRQAVGSLASALHYDDALLAKLPLDETIYRAAFGDAMAVGNPERAAALLERMRGRFPGQARLAFDLGAAYFMVARQMGHQGNHLAERTWLERAVGAMTEAVEEERTPDHLQALAEVLVQLGHFTQAVTRLREALELDPGRAATHAELADVLIHEVGGENLDDTEVPAGTAATGGGPGTATAAEREARVREAASGALAELREAARLDNNLPGLYTRIGAVYEVLHQHDDARIAFEEAVRRDPTNAEAHYALGTQYLHVRAIAQALPHLEEAARIAPLAVPIRLSLAGAYAALERWREAERELDGVDDLQPGLPQVSELRALVARLKKRG